MEREHLSASDDWKAVIPTRGDRPGLLRGLVATFGVDRVVIVHTADTTQSPDIDGCLNFRYEGPLNIQAWWKSGMEAADSRFVALVNDDVEMTTNVIPAMVGTCLALGRAMARVKGEGFTHSGFLFVIDTASGVVPDTAFQWWYGDDDMYRQAEERGGIVDIPVTGVTHHDLGGKYWTKPAFIPMINADRELYFSRWTRFEPK